MSFTTVLVLIALAGLLAALWLLTRGLMRGDAAYRRARKQAGLGLAGLLLGLGIVQIGQTERVVQRLTAPEVDGSWTAIMIDGRAVAAGAWRISVERGRVSGGRDDCNDWGYQEEEEGQPRMIVSTLVGCPQEDLVRRAYWAMATAGDAALALRDDGTLHLRARGHEGVFRRCRWTREPPPPPGSRSSGRQVCVAA